MKSFIIIKLLKKSINELTDKQILDYKVSWRQNVLKQLKNPNNESFVKAKVNFIYKLEDKMEFQF